MNREILFRGKGNPKYNNGDWFYGYLFFDGDDYQIVDPRYGSCRRTVLKETVGEFTGMTDKNGTKIFEGDIVRTQPFYDRPYSVTRKGKQFLGVVNLHTHTFKGNEVFPEQKYNSFWQVDIIEDTGKYNHYRRRSGGDFRSSLRCPFRQSSAGYRAWSRRPQKSRND